MTYESPYVITEHTQVERALKGNDTSRYTQVRLTVTRDPHGRGTVSVILRRVGGGLLSDVRLGTCTIDLSDGGPSSRDPLVALACAVGALQLRRDGEKP